MGSRCRPLAVCSLGAESTANYQTF